MIELSRRFVDPGVSVDRIVMMFNGFVLTIEIGGEKKITKTILNELFEISNMMYSTNTINVLRNTKIKLIKMIGETVEFNGLFESKYKWTLNFVNEKSTVNAIMRKSFYAKPEDDALIVCSCGCSNPESFKTCQVCGKKLNQ